MTCEPDQIDMMSEPELRQEFRNLVKHHVNTRIELEELQAKAAAYDNGTEAWEVLDGANVSICTGPTEQLTKENASILFTRRTGNWNILEGLGGTCRPVRIVEPVEQEGGE